MVNGCNSYALRDGGFAEYAEIIRHDTGDRLMHALDIIKKDDSMKICAGALASKGKDSTKPRVSLLLPGHTFPMYVLLDLDLQQLALKLIPYGRDDVDILLTSGYSVIVEMSMKVQRLERTECWQKAAARLTYASERPERGTHFGRKEEASRSGGLIRTGKGGNM